METFEKIIIERKTEEVKGFTLPIKINNVMPGDTIEVTIEITRNLNSSYESYV